jgi:hypothetical protein
MNTKTELLIAAMGWLAVFGLIAAFRSIASFNRAIAA